MSTIPDVQHPADDPFGLVGGAWPAESESSYRAALVNADDASVTAKTQAESAGDAARQTDTGMQGKTADSVTGGYAKQAGELHQQSQNYSTISAWMADAASKVEAAKRRIRQLVTTGTSEVRAALDSELQGTPTAPSSTELTDRYRSDIAQVATSLSHDLDSIGHSLAGTPGSSRTPSYTSVPTSPTTERPNPTAGVAAYNHGQAPEVTPRQLPDMPRATTSSSTESTSAPTAPAVAAPHAVNPTLANLVGGQGASTGTPSAASPHTPSPSTSPAGQGSPTHQPSEQHQTSKPSALPRIPSIPLDGLPAAAAESVATVVSAAAAHQLPTTTITPSAPTVPASTGITPGTAGTPPVTPVTPGLAPIGGGGLATPPVTQPTTPAVQGTPAAPSPTPQQTTTTPSPTPTRSPVVDAAWLQQRYGLAPGIDLPKSETVAPPALFITKLPESEARLHRALASLCHQFEQAGWAQPLAVASIRRGFESRIVYATADALSIHPAGILLPAEVTPLDEMTGISTHSDLEGSLMVTDKLAALLPRGWDVEGLLSTVPADENSQSAEQYRELVQGGELLECKVSRGRGDVTAGEAMSVFARAAIGSAGCSDLDVESSRLRGSRWVGVQPSGYLEVLGRWYLSDAAESMSEGRWGEGVYSAEKYLSVVDTKRQVA
ncbi:Uncharacterised protein [Mycobacteroides abscessus subsp. abscessus]|uniref:hypothetical protein n=1 Tax=Mycobacteroides abscessus TaxID=36809 RepID=UPI0005DDA600|nr:hypothetical protein [Mycobacteroides abscessus]MBN7556747.1 hypothetical protein [Mycobacteroides abscessus subsp. abscessus]MDO3011347.1 hypothetical protein [Mycobacteroides abscessus subsp. abscessus]MDO3046594.1 hypothetical protein [Mycobacteroides abscessus subsp. abscessus]MDO3137397.1 hypothetical protein [Mycobacteroides abscessus subsp. abscessus]MDO3155074.1 hypothetical protein [Mycobacteroides abscessus subsp. abscessus]